MRPGGIFEGYEISNHKEMPFFMRVFAASALLHLVVFAASLQLPTYVERACDSNAFTQQVCDTIYVASLFKDREFVDMPVTDPTDIPDSFGGSEVTFVETTGDFNYPEDYWALRDEIEGRMPPETLTGADGIPIDANGFPMLNSNGFYPPVTNNGFNPVPPPVNGGGLDLSKKQKLPKPGKPFVVGKNDLFTVEGGDEPATPPQTGPMGKGPNLANSKNGSSNPAGNNNNTGNKNPTTPGVDPTQNAVVPEDKYNRTPLYGFRDYLVEWREKGGNNLYQQFQSSITGTIDKDGKLTPTSPLQFNGDPKMQEFVKKAIGSFSDSGMLKLLTDLQSKGVKITFIQDGAKFNIKLESEQANDRAAYRLFSGINILLEVGINAVKRGVAEEVDPVNKQKEQATLDLLSMAKPRQEGKTFVLDAGVSNEFVEQMYKTYKEDLIKKGPQPTP